MNCVNFPQYAFFVEVNSKLEIGFPAVAKNFLPWLY